MGDWGSVWGFGGGEMVDGVGRVGKVGWDAEGRGVGVWVCCC